MARNHHHHLPACVHCRMMAFPMFRQPFLPCDALVYYSPPKFSEFIPPSIKWSYPTTSPISQQPPYYPGGLCIAYMAQVYLLLPLNLSYNVFRVCSLIWGVHFLSLSITPIILLSMVQWADLSFFFFFFFSQ